MAVFVTHSSEETQQLGATLGRALSGGQTVALTGPLGAGKTAFCRGLAAGLGCTDEVSSPTFAIVNYYRGPTPLAHFDAWRIAGEDDLAAAGLYDYLDAGAVAAVEWSENVRQFLDPPIVTVDIRVCGEEEREITIEGAEL